MRKLFALATALMLAAAVPAVAQSNSNGATQSKPAAGEKICRHKFPDGTPKTWVCKQAEPCCAWDAIKYVKCGSVAFKCL